MGTLPTLVSALTILELPSHVAARSVKLRLRLMPMLKPLSFMEDMDTHMLVDMEDMDILVLDMLVLVMLDLDMLDLDMLMEAFTPPTLLSAMPLHTPHMELPTPPMLECALTTLEPRFLASSLFSNLTPEIYQSTWD